MQSTLAFAQTSLMLAPNSPSINYYSGPPAGYQLSTIRREVDDHTVLDLFTRSSVSDLADFLCPLRKSVTDEDYSTIDTNGRKRHYPYVTSDGSKKYKGDGHSIFGEEVVTYLPLQSGNLLSSPIGAVSNSQNPNYGEVWIDILEEPEEVKTIQTQSVAITHSITIMQPTRFMRL